MNGKEVEGADKNNHVWNVCADTYNISMHTISLTSAPEGLFGGNLIAAFFPSKYLPQSYQTKSGSCECGGVFISLSLVGLLKQTVSIDLWGSQHSETSICWCHRPLGNNKGQSVCVNQLMAGIWTPAPQGEDPIIIFACCTALQREQQSLRHHAQIWQCLLSVYLAISQSSPCDLAASAVRLINSSHQQEVLRPIRPGKVASDFVSIKLVCPWEQWIMNNSR